MVLRIRILFSAPLISTVGSQLEGTLTEITLNFESIYNFIKLCLFFFVMNIIKICRRTELNPQTLVEIIEDESTTWGVTEPIEAPIKRYTAKLVALCIQHYRERYIFDLAGKKSYSISIPGKTIAIDVHHPVGETRHVDHVSQWAYLDELPDFTVILRQFENCGYRLIG